METLRLTRAGLTTGEVEGRGGHWVRSGRREAKWVPWRSDVFVGDMWRRSAVPEAGTKACMMLRRRSRDDGAAGLRKGFSKLWL